LVGLLLASAILVGVPQRVAANCPGTSSGALYAGAHQFLANAANGVKGDIQWTNPTVCTNPSGNAFSLEGITLCSSGTCPGWVQVGWVKRQSLDSSPKMYCEYKWTDSPVVTQYWFSITAATHKLQVGHAERWLVLQAGWRQQTGSV
jgi:hypothetical protein